MWAASDPIRKLEMRRARKGPSLSVVIFVPSLQAEACHRLAGPEGLQVLHLDVVEGVKSPESRIRLGGQGREHLFIAGGGAAVTGLRRVHEAAQARLQRGGMGQGLQVAIVI